MSDGDAVTRTRAALTEAGFTVDGCLEVLGGTAYAAMSRGETVPALRATRGESPRETLIRLFLLQSAVGAAAAAAALPLAEAQDGGLVEVSGGEVRATVGIRPYGEADVDWWVVSDLGAGSPGYAPGPDRRPAPDRVLGVGGASTSLAQLTVRPPLRTALDLGTRCGVQSLHLSRHVGQVTATDVNPHALELARLTLALSGAGPVELLEGDRYRPVTGRRFDLVVSNPPFVISPAGPETRLTYRDSGLPADEMSRQVIAEAVEYLAPGGWCQVLANWLHVGGQDWRERLAGWVVPTGCDAWVVQRELLDPAAYAEMWLRDSADVGTPAYARRYDAWLDYFDRLDVEAVGLGWVTLHAGADPRAEAGGAAQRPSVRIEELHQAVRTPLGPHVLDWFTRQAFLRGTSDAALLDTVLRVAPDTRLEQLATVGESGWQAESQRLLQLDGLCRSGAVDPVGASVLAGCEGSRPLGEILDTVAQEAGITGAQLRTGALDAVRSLVEEGFLRVV